MKCVCNTYFYMKMLLFISKKGCRYDFEFKILSKASV